MNLKLCTLRSIEAPYASEAPDDPLDLGREFYDEIWKSGVSVAGFQGTRLHAKTEDWCERLWRFKSSVNAYSETPNRIGTLIGVLACIAK